MQVFRDGRLVYRMDSQSPSRAAQKRRGGCPREGIVAGCEQKTGNADGSRTIDWYYSPKTEEQVKASCTSPSTFQPKP